MYAEAGRRVFTGGLYEVTDTYAWPYSPLLAIAMGPLTSVGFVVWRWAQLLAVAALPTWRLRLLTFVSWPFWFDVQHAALTTFTLLAAGWALAGNRMAQISYMAICLLVPRPLYLPLLLWLLWKQPGTRLPFVGLVGVNIAGVALSGWASEWIGAMGDSSLALGSQWNLGPSRILGVWWYPLAAVIVAALLVRGRIGAASLAAAPYLSPYYLLFGLLELVRPRPAAAR